jgi:plasmid maintenance system antidote protein VapI
MARTPVHPGEHLAEELRELSMSAAELSRQIEAAVNRITGIINAQRALRRTLPCGSVTGSAPARSSG